MAFRALTIPFADPDLFEDAFNDDPRELPDSEFNDNFACIEATICSNAAGHVYLTACGVTWCLYCKTVVA